MKRRRLRGAFSVFVAFVSKAMTERLREILRRSSNSAE